MIKWSVTKKINLLFYKNLIFGLKSAKDEP